VQFNLEKFKIVLKFTIALVQDQLRELTNRLDNSKASSVEVFLETGSRGYSWCQYVIYSAMYIDVGIDIPI